MPAPSPLITLAILCSAGLAIAGHYLRPPRPVLIYIFKPLTTILIILVALLSGAFPADAYARAVVLGLNFSLAGDVFLMLPHERFMQGLVAFLLAHICYIVAFHGGAAARGFAWVLLGLLAFGAAVLAYLWKGVPPRMRIPVLIYMTAILLMASLAVGRALGQPSAKTLSAALGALLFVASDSLLAINRFRRPFHPAQAFILGVYFAAQYLIALSV
ncbi:MAG TPA: lysoplasmalogenase [Anaerolineales bacterium]|nr:lysoplasmalogenase [Anaerolineales bacterium]